MPRWTHLLIACFLGGPAQAAALFTIRPDSDPIFPAPRQLTTLTTAGVPATVGAPLGDGSGGFNGGLAYRTVDGLIYGIANDLLGASSLVSFNTSGGSLTPIASLGSGFVGGLAYRATADRFYAIANDSLAVSVLDHFSLAGGGAFSPIAAIGSGFLNAGLALVPEHNVVPEPDGLVLVLARLCGTVAARRACIARSTAVPARRLSKPS